MAPAASLMVPLLSVMLNHWTARPKLDDSSREKVLRCAEWPRCACTVTCEITCPGTFHSLSAYCVKYSPCEENRVVRAVTGAQKVDKQGVL